MVTLQFENLRFRDMEDKIRVLFLTYYYFYIEKKDLKNIGDVSVDKHTITFKTNKKKHNVEQRFSFLLSKGFDNLMSTINGKPTLYIHKNSGIPLIGSNAFGVIDRGTNTIEIKPITTCNVDCLFCSVDHLQRHSDIVVEKDYLVEELEKVIDIKEHKVNIHIGSQGDSSLYGDLIPLVRDIRKDKRVHAISMVTNGMLLTKKTVDALVDAGMTHFHVSLHTTDEKKGDELAQAPYPVKKVMESCRYIMGKKGAHLLIVPVLVPGINDKDVEDVIQFAIEIGADLGIQNFLSYKFGKTPVKGIAMDKFMQLLHGWGKKYNLNLTTLTSDLAFHDDNTMPKQFKKGDIITVELKAKNRLKRSAIAVAKDRVVTVINTDKTQGTMKVKLIRDKDNVFTGVPA